MIDTWIQFGILLAAIVAFAVRNERRITKLEDRYTGLSIRVTTLERKRT